jgi:hypothetical protein
MNMYFYNFKIDKKLKNYNYNSNIINRMSVQYNDYKIKRTVAEKIVELGGYIFGGYVRDKLLHDLHAQDYYSYMHENDFDVLNNYHNSEMHPQSFDRVIVANDIDCYMKKADFEKLKKSLNEMRLNVVSLWDSDPSEYLVDINIPPNIMRHHRYKISTLGDHLIKKIRKILKNNIVADDFRNEMTSAINTFIDEIEDISRSANNIIFYLDIFTPVDDVTFDTYEAPFSNVDFECNGLIYSKKGIHISQHILKLSGVYMNPLNVYQKMSLIISDIKNRIATPINMEIGEYRIRKMIKKDWTIQNDSFQIVKKPLMMLPNLINTNEEDVCIICLENFENKSIYKLPCCNAYYHLPCLIKVCEQSPAAYRDTNSCMVCKKDVFVYDDFKYLQRIQSAFDTIEQEPTMHDTRTVTLPLLQVVVSPAEPVIPTPIVMPIMNIRVAHHISAPRQYNHMVHI